MIAKPPPPAPAAGFSSFNPALIGCRQANNIRFAQRVGLGILSRA